jgi:hypothetical protein
MATKILPGLMLGCRVELRLDEMLRLSGVIENSPNGILTNVIILNFLHFMLKNVEETDCVKN